MPSIQQLLVGTVLKFPDWLLLRVSGEPQHRRGHRRLLPAFQCLCALMEKHTTPFEKLSPNEARAVQDDAPVELDPPPRDLPDVRNHTVPVDGGEITTARPGRPVSAPIR